MFSFLAGLVELISEFAAAIASGLTGSVLTAFGMGQEPPFLAHLHWNVLYLRTITRMLCMPPSPGKACLPRMNASEFDFS